jgi:hypothetical protein
MPGQAKRRPGEGSGERTRSKILGSWFTVILSALCGIALAFHFHYKVPLPANHLGYNAETGLSDFSELNAMNIISHLSDTIGYRKLTMFFTRSICLINGLLGIVGTIEEQQSYEYINDVITQYKNEAQGIVGSPKFDIWVQQGTSSHRFDIMDKSMFSLDNMNYHLQLYW